MSTSPQVLKPDSAIYIAGHSGMVGSAIMRRLQAQGFNNLITRTHRELDLVNQADVQAFFDNEPVDYVVLAAATVGGINANNSQPARFIYENLMMESNIISAAHQNGINRLLFLGSSCIYPRMAEQPMRENVLLTGELESTNEPYAVAKIAGIKLCESFNRQYGTHYRSVMPTNLYGPYDNFNLQDSHVVPALIRKFHEGKEKGEPGVEVWGTGNARREFMHVDDMAEASVFIMELNDMDYDGVVEPMLSHINVGTGEDVTIKELAGIVCEITGFNGDIIFNENKPDGAPKKLLNVDKLKRLGWRAKITLREGIASTYEWFLDNLETARGIDKQAVKK